MHKSLQLKQSIKSVAYQASALVVAFSTLMFSLSGTAGAAAITSRKVTLGSSVASASTTYGFSFVLPTATIVKSVEAIACTTASGACTTPSGFTAVGSTLTGQPVNMGDASGWTVNAATAGRLRALNNANVTTPTGTTTISWSSVTNPSATNSTFFLRIGTFSDATWTTSLDSGTVAASTAGQITVTASVDEALTFTLSSATVGLGTLTTATTGSGTSSMTASTNGSTGYAITVNGTTLTAGAKTIAALASQTASSQNTSQFGINLLANTVPSVGTAVSGAGTGTPSANYNTTNQYRFVTGDIVASAAAETNSNTYTTSYIANIGGSQAAGSYSTALTYIATPTF